MFLNYHRICDYNNSATILYYIETTKQNIYIHIYIYGPVSRIPTPPMGWGGDNAPVVVYIHTYIPTYLQTYLPTYIPTYIHTYHYITLPYITLHCLTLHNLTLHSIHTNIHTNTKQYLTIH
jgi:hypothetical protein